MFVIAMANIPVPTERAAIISIGGRELSAADSIAGMRSMDEHIPPATTATAWPPMTLRGVAATLFGTMKIVKAEEATATTIAALRTASSTIRITTSETVAKPHWNR